MRASLQRALESHATHFPECVWTHPLLAALDARARSELEHAGALRALDANEKLFGVGDPADALYVVITGEVVLRAGARRAELRRVCPGEVVGEEAAARAHGVRRHDATGAERSEVALLPAALLRRVMARGEETDAGRRTKRWLLRSLASDALERSDFSRDLSARDREMMLDAGRVVELRRGDVLHREGDPSTEAYFLAEGIVQLAVAGPAANTRVLAYHKAGDFFGDEVTHVPLRGVGSEPRDSTATATSDAWIFAVNGEVVRELAANHPDALARALRVQTAARDQQRDIRINATRNVLQDLHRFETARSLLAIDQESCLRCGHCAWSCAEAHDDGISRLLRRGDVVVAKMQGRTHTLLLPSSCQHCKNPACMIDCPTGAISRDAHGEVHIREELCTGCGSCAKACPWDNIQMAPRGKKSLPIVRTDSSSVAVKCDLCQGRDDGPACVSACPTAALVRVDPSVDLDDIRAVIANRGAHVSSPAAHASKSNHGILTPSLLAFAGLASLGVVQLLDGASRRVSGYALLTLVTALLAYAAVKRLGLRAPFRMRRALTVRAHFVAHLSLGIAAVVVALVHARGHSALAVAFWGASALGLGAGIVGWLAPKRLARIERQALLPEDLGARARELDAQVFRDLTGRSDLLKGLYASVLKPFSRSATVFVSMCALGTSQRVMRARLDARVRSIVSSDDERLAGLEGLIAVVVERQAVRAQRVLTTLLRTTSFAHVVVAAGLTALVVLHVIAQLGLR